MGAGVLYVPQPRSLPVAEPQPQPLVARRPVQVEYVYATYPRVRGSFVRPPNGTVDHASASGRAQPIDDEYRGTVNWVNANPDELAWSATVGDWKLAIHMGFDEWGYHAGGSSSRRYGIELAKGVTDGVISDGQVAAYCTFQQLAAAFWRTRGETYRVDVRLSHAEAEASGETGLVYGKIDVYPLGSGRYAELKARIATQLRLMGLLD